MYTLKMLRNWENNCIQFEFEIETDKSQTLTNNSDLSNETWNTSDSNLFNIIKMFISWLSICRFKNGIRTWAHIRVQCSVNLINFFLVKKKIFMTIMGDGHGEVLFTERMIRWTRTPATILILQLNRKNKKVLIH